MLTLEDHVINLIYTLYLIKYPQISDICRQWIVCELKFVFFESHPFVALCPIALIFEGSVNPAHPKHIGSIDPSCDVVEVVKGNEWSSPAPILLSSHTQKHTHTLTRLMCYLFSPTLFVQIHDCLTFYYLIFLESIYRVWIMLSWCAWL